jgi:hypothetical protein
MKLTSVAGDSALEAVVEGQGVEQDGAGRVGAVGRQPAVVLSVHCLREGALVAFDGGDVGLDGRDQLALAQASDDLLADGLEAGVQVVQVDRVGVRRALFPEPGDGAGQEAQHAAHALEVAEGGGLLAQRGDQLRVQRIAGLQRLRAAVVRALRWQVVAMAIPELAVGVDNLGGAGVVDVGEQAPAQDADGLVFLRGVE